MTDILNGAENGVHKIKAGTKHTFQLLIEKILDHKLFFILSIAISLGLAYLSIRYTEPVYLVRTSLLIRETKNQSNNPHNMLYGEADNDGAAQSHIPEEVAILQSYPFIYRTLDALNMRITFFQRGQLQQQELYDVPFYITFPDKALFQKLIGRSFAVTFSDATHFRLYETITQRSEKSGATHSLGYTFTIDGCPVVLNPKGGKRPDIHKLPDFEFKVNDLRELAFQYKNSLNIRTNGPESSILDIYLATKVPQKGIDFLNEFTRQYLNYKFEEKSRAVSQSLAFINDQLDLISRSLGATENSLVKFKTTHAFSDASEMNDRGHNALTNLEKDRVAIELNERYYTAMLRNLADNSGAERLVAPSSVGIVDKRTDDLINELASLQSERNSFQGSAGSKNPLIKDIDTKINAVQNTLKGNLTVLLNSNRTKLAQVNAKSSQYQASINSLPKAERKFTDIKRENNLNEQIYLFLSQKKLEAGIIKAATTVENQIIESAMLDSAAPLKPKKKNNYAIALLAGMAFPFGWLWLQNLFNKKISGRNEFQNLISLPIIGTIFHNANTLTQVMTPAARTAIAESFRLLRSHLTSAGHEYGNKTILVTSMDSGDGKSFCAVNIAASLALIKKKTVLIDLDLRTQNSKQPFPNDGPGISAYLTETATLDDIINTTATPYLDFIPAGEIPAHASELVNDEKIVVLLQQLKGRYAYVIIDSPPVGKVADPFIIAKYTNLNLVVVRLNHTLKERLTDLERIHKEGRLKNISVLLNDERLTKESYKNKYYHEDLPAIKKLV